MRGRDKAGEPRRRRKRRRNKINSKEKYEEKMIYCFPDKKKVVMTILINTLFCSFLRLQRTFT